MNLIFIALKVLLYSVIGYYIEAFASKKENVFKTMIFPFYGLFGLLAVFSDKMPIVYLFVLGIAWGTIVNFLLEAIDCRLKTELNVKYLGLVNIFSVLVLEDIMDWFILNSSSQSIVFLFIFGISIFLIDIATTLRRLL